MEQPVAFASDTKWVILYSHEPYPGGECEIMKYSNQLSRSIKMQNVELTLLSNTEFE